MLKVFTACAVAMFVAVPAFAQDIASTYANKAAIAAVPAVSDINSAANQGAIAAVPTASAVDSASHTADQQLLASRQDAKARQFLYSNNDTGPYVDDNPQ